jgi:hypothetical protein
MHMQAESVAIPDTHDHQGRPNPPDTRFFAAPPPEIGTILSAHTNNMVGKKQRIEWLKQGFGGLAFGVIVIGMFGNFIFHIPLVIAFPLGLVVGAFLAWLVPPRPVCTFVGDKGIAKIKRTPKRDWQDVFLFSAQSSVGVSVTERYSNGIYSGTSFIYTFYDGSPNTLFEVRGSYQDKYGQKISPDSEFYFAKQGEVALINYLLPLAQKRLMQGEDQSFMLKDRRQIILQADALTISANNKTYTIPYLDLQNITMNNGTIEIRGQGGNSGFLGISQKGVFSFPYSDMPNAQLLFALLQQKIRESHQKNN